MDAPIKSHDCRAVANEILRIAKEVGVQLSIMKLIKLVFFAHGWSLALFKKPISKHEAQAWQYGPVYPLIYKNYSGAGSTKIDDYIKDKLTGLDIIDDFTEQEQALLKDVIEGYGSLHAFKLSGMTHAKDSPWDRTIREKGLYSTIPNEWIQEYFSSFNSNE